MLRLMLAGIWLMLMGVVMVIGGLLGIVILLSCLPEQVGACLAVVGGVAMTLWALHVVHKEIS